jgi:hypothetical protein
MKSDGLNDAAIVALRQSIIRTVEIANERARSNPPAAPQKVSYAVAAERAHSAARNTRDAVKVTLPSRVPATYKSTGAAFRALKLPLSQCIRFRLRLKAERRAVFNYENVEYLFEIL